MHLKTHLGGLGGFKAGELHAAPRFGILHEGIPNKPGPQIFRHQHGDSRIDADDVGVESFIKGVERVDEAIFAPGLISIEDSDVAKDAQRRLR